MSSTERELARRVWDAGLVDQGELLGEAEPPVPERYTLEREIGRGGGGRVYLARDASLQRPVALKYLHDASPGDLERFRREARFTARLNDPSIVQVYEMGEVEGAAYIAMQYVDGANLRDAPLTTEALVRALRSVARALQRAHAIGIVHRDIKPENILLDGNGNAYLTDFGIARDLSGTLGVTMSREGQIMGTPGLMPPEQARGEPHAVDSRSDVYTLGATLYVKLTGRYPFEGDNIVEVLHAIIHAEPRLPRAHDPAIPRALEAIAMKCLAKDRGERYQGMGEVVAALDGFLAGRNGAPDGNAWFRRLVGKQESAPPPPDPVETLEDTTFHRGMELVREISAWDADLYRVSGSLERSFARLDGIGARLEEILEAAPDAAWARFYRGVVHFRRGRLDDALEDMECAIDRVKDLAGAYFELGRLYLVLHLREQRMARKHIVQPGIEMGLEAARRRLEQAKVAFQEARSKRGELLPWHEDYAEAVTRLADCDYDACVEVCDRILREEPDLEEVWKLRGDAQCLGGGDPFASYHRAVDVRRSYFEAFHAIGEAHLDRGQFEEARVALERAVSIHAGFAEARALLARLALPADGEAPVEEELRRGVDHARAALDLDPHSYAGVVALAQLQLELGRLRGNPDCLDEALATLDRASELDGCQNRVNLMRADTLLERVALLASDPGSRGDLERVRSYLEQATAETDEDGPWGGIRARLARYSGA